MAIPPYRPQLAQLVKTAPSGAEWLHELKYDGYRIGCRIDKGRVTLVSRNGKDWTAAFPEVARAAGRLAVKNALLDGEVCIVLPDGRTSFQALQNVFSGGTRDGLVYIVFDLLYLDGRTLLREPLTSRKEALHRIVAGNRVQYAEHLDTDGPAAFAAACSHGAEGIVSKRRNAPYETGKRTGWLKTKCVQRQEFVIGGFTDPEGSRQGIGALLVGYYDGSRLAFAGKVGTGFTTASARDLRRTLEGIEIDACPFSPRPGGWLGRNAHWVEPALVAEVVFTEWTDEDKIRHPSFQGLRSDRSPRSVVRESPADAAAETRAQGSSRAPRPKSRPSSARSSSNTIVRGITITHPDRVMYDEPRLTKLDVARYYDLVAPAMMPHVVGRPLTLVRCGEGIRAGCLYMKHSKVWSPPALTRIKIAEKTKTGEYLVIESPEAIIALAQMDILEIHTWNTCKDHVEYPDRVVIDLDPGAQVPWRVVIESARRIRRLLHTLDLECFVKTTGGKGLHVVVPLAPRHDWKACLEFARAIAAAMARHEPALFTLKFGKSGRENRILIDYLRNNRTNTSIAAFSTRARAGAPVSVPLAWTELKESLDPRSFTLESVPHRLKRLRKDPWAEYFGMRQRLTSTMVRALGAVT
jgi:bifunctional non-homologous end joining protein LigD